MYDFRIASCMGLYDIPPQHYYELFDIHKVAWHKNQRKFEFCICINSKIILYVRVSYSLKKHIVRLSALYEKIILHVRV